ncbi:558_t:CDS:2 [Racocetra fulgida]|uniref:558_t:CDS:1 n=1 Tax=Racocetra fulgida TaxID=60492 RepID=A0A9N9C3T5_9GLOM|nr:558_t:CDS:2 [Racocetra fulgida]
MTEEAKEIKEHITEVKIESDYDKKRREALAQIDNAKFGWFHIRTCCVAGSNPPTSVFKSNSQVVSIQGLMIFLRVLLGIGIGGDYPLSAVIASEFATTKRRGAMISAVFAMQGIGILVAAIISTITVAAFQSTISPDDYSHIDYIWRIVTGCGAIPGCIALYFRLTIPETPRYTMDIERNIDQAAADINTVLEHGVYKPREQEVVVKVDAPKFSVSDFFRYFGKWENGKVLFGTAFTWFALDVAFYGIGLNNNIILGNIGFLGDGRDPYETLFKASVGNIIIALLGTVPGYWVTVFTVDFWGRRPIQLLGFAVLTVVFIILGFAYKQIKEITWLFIIFFTIAQFFFNFGPNATTFVVPGEVFPTRYRSTGHGISAAAGKLGAIISQVGFFKLKDIGGKDAYIDNLFKIFAVFMLSGLIVTYFCVPETKGKTLEELSNEDQDGFIKGVNKPKIIEANAS